MKRWRFVPNHNSVITGINDAGIETFTAHMIQSLVRETVQNSLDARIETSEEPVIVEFSDFNIPIDHFPDYSTFTSVLGKCLHSNHDEPAAKEFFEKAIETVASNIRVLRISDYNTFGLRGSDTCAKGTAWSRLVKESGSSNKGDNAGGSFGIGKSAVFACSDLRTVFYSSLDDKGLKSSIGVAKLVSFENDDNSWTTGTGYFSEDNSFVAYGEVASFQARHVRTQPGTDIYILGFTEYDGFQDEIIRSILINFFISIVKKKLIVKVNNSVIDDRSIGKLIAGLNPYDSSKEVAALVHYYRLITSNSPSIKKIVLNVEDYGKKFGFKDGDCVLYLQEGEKLNRRVLMTRSAGMRLFEQDRFSSGIEFTGILMIEGQAMNQVFRQMEVPSHDAWEPGRCKQNTKKYEAAYRELKRYIREQVVKNFGQASTSDFDAFGASDFLPIFDRIDETARESKNDRQSLIERIRNIVGKEQKPTRQKTRPLKLDEETVDPVVVDKRVKPIEPKKPHNNDAPKFVEHGIRPRAVCVNRESGTYRVKLVVPKKASQGYLEFVVSGEQDDYPANILHAEVLDAKTAELTEVDKNQVWFSGLSAGEVLVLQINIDFRDYCMMEVQYYATKR